MERPERHNYQSGRMGEMDYNEDNRKYIDHIEDLLSEYKTKIRSGSVVNISNLACERCKRSLSPRIKDGECIICNSKL